MLPLGDRKLLKDFRFSAYFGECCVGYDPSSGDSGVEGGMGLNTDGLLSHSLGFLAFEDRLVPFSTFPSPIDDKL